MLLVVGSLRAKVASFVLLPAMGENHLDSQLIFIGPTSDQSFSHSFEATPGTRAAARCNQVTVGVHDLKRNSIGELIRVASELDGTRQPVCLYPDSGGAKNEGLGHCAVVVAACVPPDTDAGSAYGGGLACSRKGKRTSIAEDKQGREGPQRRTCLTVADRELHAPRALNPASLRFRLSPGL